MLFWTEDGDVGKAKKAAKVFAPVYGFLGVFFCGGYYVIGILENFFITILDAIDLAPSHWVGANELDIGAEGGLDVVDDAAFDASDVGDFDAGFEEVLVGADPVEN